MAHPFIVMFKPAVAIGTQPDMAVVLFALAGNRRKCFGCQPAGMGVPELLQAEAIQVKNRDAGVVIDGEMC